MTGVVPSAEYGETPIGRAVDGAPQPERSGFAVVAVAVTEATPGVLEQADPSTSPPATRYGCSPQPGSNARRPDTGAVQVLVADRHPLYLESVARAIERHPTHLLAGKTRDGFTALELIREAQPHVAVLETRLDGLDGLGVLTAVTREELATSVMFLTANQDPAVVHAAAAGGASAYLTKAPDTDVEQLYRAIAAVASGGIVLSPYVHSALACEIRRRAGREEPLLDGTTYEILTLTAAGRGVREIAEQLHLAPSTVKTRLHSVYKRLGVAAPTAAVAEAMRRRLID